MKTVSLVLKVSVFCILWFALMVGLNFAPLPADSRCNFAPLEIRTGIVKQIKIYRPTIKTNCGVLAIKLIIEDPYDSEDYIGYLTPESLCDGQPCGMGKIPDLVRYSYLTKVGKSGHRGQITEITTIDSLEED